MLDPYSELSMFLNELNSGQGSLFIALGYLEVKRRKLSFYPLIQLAKQAKLGFLPGGRGRGACGSKESCPGRRGTWGKLKGT